MSSHHLYETNTSRLAEAEVDFNASKLNITLNDTSLASLLLKRIHPTVDFLLLKGNSHQK